MRSIEEHQGGGRFRRSIEVLKDAVPLSEYAGELTELKNAGGDRLVGLCPIHEEKTPSFFVYEDGHFHCFGCEAHGDVLDLFMAVEKIPAEQAGTALAELAQQRGVELPGRSDSWHEATARKAEIRDLAGRVRGAVYKRRAFALLVEPVLEAACPDEADFQRERALAWRDFGTPDQWRRWVEGFLTGNTLRSGA